MRPLRVLGWLAALCSLCGAALGEDYWAPPPPPGVPARESRGGILGPLVTAVSTFVGAKVLFGRNRATKMRKKHQAKYAAQNARLQRQVEEHMEAYDAAIKSYKHKLEQTLNEIDYLEQKLFKLPDQNNDNLINRNEFDAYMRKYKQMHPQLREIDLPRFGDMDHDGSGVISFPEWEQYMAQVLGGQ